MMQTKLAALLVFVGFCAVDTAYAKPGGGWYCYTAVYTRVDAKGTHVASGGFCARTQPGCLDGLAMEAREMYYAQGSLQPTGKICEFQERAFSYVCRYANKTFEFGFPDLADCASASVPAHGWTIVRQCKLTP